MGNLNSLTPAEIEQIEKVKVYCNELPWIRFCGQTSSITVLASRSDQSMFSVTSINNLGSELKKLDSVIRKSPPEEFNEDNEEVDNALKRISAERRNHTETKDECYQRLKKESKAFGEIYRKRKAYSQPLADEHTSYWGTRQQMLFGKVVSDWITPTELDPIFGLLLNPTGGRVGAGNSTWLHNVLYDDTGRFAFHSAVHDAFGYLKSLHDCGPGYDYMEGDLKMDKNPLAGQISGLRYWTEVLRKIKSIKKTYVYV